MWSTLEIKQSDISTFELKSIVKKALEELEDKDHFSDLHMDSKQKKGRCSMSSRKMILEVLKGARRVLLQKACNNKSSCLIFTPGM